MNYASEIGPKPGYDEGVEGVTPTSENSKRKTDSSQLPSEENSPTNTGNLSC